ncbi:MAG: hypothetical protein COT17_06740 [Elusimicrobia bacterium CG08_land_8_20_14_0_20_51_18]|nr:MAG: hypothetical protein COT17_06740 [Elusimicrobia bacterium CG08_land_8_20_14_0_20_51_18]
MSASDIKNANMIGIYINLEEVVISRTVLEGSAVKVEKIASIQTNFKAKDKIIKPLSLNNEFFNEKQEWVAKFKDAVKKGDFSPGKVNVTLSHYFSITRFFVMPSIDRKFWNKSIPIESRKYIPVAFDEMSYDFYAYPLSDGKKIAVLFGITHRKTVEFLMEIFKPVSLEIDSVETSSVSFERALSLVDSREHALKAYVHFFKEFSYSLFSANNCPVIFREMSMEDASGISERKSLDLKGSIAFVKRYVPDQNYLKMAVSGDNAALWQKLAESESGLKTEMLDLSKAMGLKDNSFPVIASLGASLKGKFQYKQGIDISGMSANRNLHKKVQAYIIGISTFIAGIFLLLALMNNVQIFLLSGKVSALKNQMSDVADFANLPEDMVRIKVEDVQKQARLMRVLFSEKEFLAPKLQIISEKIPKDLWVIEIDYVNPVGISEVSRENKELIIKGETSLEGEYKYNMVEYFTKEIKKAAEFRTFTAPRGAIEPVLEGAGDKRGRRDLEISETTGYTINCVRKNI